MSLESKNINAKCDKQGNDKICCTNEDLNDRLVCQNVEEKVIVTVTAKLGTQSFTFLMADLCQDINRVSSFSRCHNGTFP